MLNLTVPLRLITGREAQISQPANDRESRHIAKPSYYDNLVVSLATYPTHARSIHRFITKVAIDATAKESSGINLDDFVRIFRSALIDLSERNRRRSNTTMRIPRLEEYGLKMKCKMFRLSPDDS